MCSHWDKDVYTVTSMMLEYKVKESKKSYARNKESKESSGKKSTVYGRRKQTLTLAFSEQTREWQFSR